MLVLGSNIKNTLRLERGIMNKQELDVTEKKAEDKKLKSRRKLLKAMGITAMSMAASSVLPTSWTKPIIEFGAVPAHAQLSPMYDINLEGLVAPDGTAILLVAAINPTPPTGSRVRFNLLRTDHLGATVAEEFEVEINDNGIASYGPVDLKSTFDYHATADLFDDNLEGVPIASSNPVDVKVKVQD